MLPAEIDKVITENWLLKTNKEIGKMCGLSSESVRKRGVGRLELPNKGMGFGSQLHSEHEALKKEAESVGIPVNDINHYWHKGKHFSIFAKNKLVDFEIVKNELIADVKKYAPKYPTLKRPKLKDSSLFVIDPADPHFGAYASKEETSEAYNLNIATKRYNEGFEGLLNKGAFYNHEKIVIIGGNDIVHTDNPFGTTTSGTRQDTDGMWFEAFQAAKWANIGIIEKAATVANVHFIHCPSNHDYATGFFLAQCLEAWFRNNKNVTFDISPSHRKYLQYGVNLIGMTHGDGAKEVDLSNCMTREAKKAWSESVYAYWYLHHRHHKDVKARGNKQAIALEKDGKAVSVINSGTGATAKDFFHVEYVRSIKPPDSWHHRNSFDGSFQAMEGFIHHPQYGQISRLTHLF
jgi:hypothetical protein